MVVLTASEIRGLEACAVESGVTLETLMENAGQQVAEFIQEKTEVRDKRLVVLCGKGNNGGDGFVIARLLSKAGGKVTVVLADGLPSSELAKQAYNKMTKSIDIIYARKAGAAIGDADIIIDAIYGIRFRGKLPREMECMMEQVNGTNALRIAVDVPSGARCDTGAVEGKCFMAHYTVTFTAMKPSGVLYPAAKYSGMTVVRQVGIRREFLEMLPCDTESVLLGNLCKLFPKRDAEGHKGTYGRLVMICGSVGMAGACIMAARGALRSGVGLLNIVIPHALYPILAPMVPEAVFTLYEIDDTLSKTLTDVLKNATACLVGCGLGTAEYAKRIVYTVLEQAKCPVVLDADALNILSEDKKVLRKVKVPVVVTPHPGEMVRLTGKLPEDIHMDRMGCAKQFAADYKVITVLKGAGTVIAAPDGRVRVNTTGNAGMAKGGSGDVLAGVLAALAAQKLDPFEAAYAAVCIHGAAGDRCEAALSQHGMLPTDLIEALPAVWKDIEGKA